MSGMKKFINFKIHKLLTILSASLLASLVSCGGGGGVIGVVDFNSASNSSNITQKSGSAAISVIIGALL